MRSNSRRQHRVNRFSKRERVLSKRAQENRAKTSPVASNPKQNKQSDKHIEKRTLIIGEEKRLFECKANNGFDQAKHSKPRVNR